MTRVVTFGEIMLRLSPPNQLRFTQARSFDVIYGGEESNVVDDPGQYLYAFGDDPDINLKSNTMKCLP